MDFLVCAYGLLRSVGSWSVLKKPPELFAAWACFWMLAALVWLFHEQQDRAAACCSSYASLAVDTCRCGGHEADHASYIKHSSDIMP